MTCGPQSGGWNGPRARRTRVFSRTSKSEGGDSHARPYAPHLETAILRRPGADRTSRSADSCCCYRHRRRSLRHLPAPLRWELHSHTPAHPSADPQPRDADRLQERRRGVRRSRPQLVDMCPRGGHRAGSSSDAEYSCSAQGSFLDCKRASIDPFLLREFRSDVPHKGTYVVPNILGGFVVVFDLDMHGWVSPGVLNAHQSCCYTREE